MIAVRFINFPYNKLSEYKFCASDKCYLSRIEISRRNMFVLSAASVKRSDPSIAHKSGKVAGMLLLHYVQCYDAL